MSLFHIWLQESSWVGEKRRNPNWWYWGRELWLAFSRRGSSSLDKEGRRPDCVKTDVVKWAGCVVGEGFYCLVASIFLCKWVRGDQLRLNTVGLFAGGPNKCHPPFPPWVLSHRRNKSEESAFGDMFALIKLTLRMRCVPAVRWVCWLLTQQSTDVGGQCRAGSRAPTARQHQREDRQSSEWKKVSTNDKNRKYLTPKTSEIIQNILIKLAARPLYTQDKTSLDLFPLYHVHLCHSIQLPTSPP